MGGAVAGIRRLGAEEDESSEEFRDYTTLEWWRVPARDGSRHITGPYVDNLCTDGFAASGCTGLRVAAGLR